MVGTVLAALGVAAMLDMAQPAPPDPVGKLVDALALTRSCPFLKLDQDAVSMSMAKQGIRLAPLMPEIMSRSRNMAVRYVLLKPREACRLGRRLYGSGGTEAAGYLAER